MLKGHGTPHSAESAGCGAATSLGGRQSRQADPLHQPAAPQGLHRQAQRQPFKVLGGSTNFSFRGLYIQANNVLVFHAPGVARLFGDVFDAAFANLAAFKASSTGLEVARRHHRRQPDRYTSASRRITPRSCRSTRCAARSTWPSSSVLYSVAFLNQIGSGPTKEAFDRLMTKPLFSYGIVNTRGDLEVRKPDGSSGWWTSPSLPRTRPSRSRQSGAAARASTCTTSSW